MKEIKIRPGTPQDAEAVAKVLDSVPWPHPYFKNPHERQKAVARQLAGPLEPGVSHLLVAELESRLVGYVMWHCLPCLYLPNPEAYVSDCFVLDGYRGQKIGQSLLQAVAGEAKAKGVPPAFAAEPQEPGIIRARLLQKGWLGPSATTWPTLCWIFEAKSRLWPAWRAYLNPASTVPPRGVPRGG